MFSLFRAPTLVVDQFKRLIQGHLVIAAIVLHAGHRAVRKGIRRDEIAAARLRRIETQLMGDAVHGAFKDIGRFWPTRAAVGARWHFIGESA